MFRFSGMRPYLLVIAALVCEAQGEECDDVQENNVQFIQQSAVIKKASAPPARLGDLRRSALAAGVSEAAADDALNADDPRATLIARAYGVVHGRVPLITRGAQRITQFQQHSIVTDRSSAARSNVTSGTDAAVMRGISELSDAAMKCPGSGATMHAGMKLIAMANASCSDVKAEAKARVAGQNGWVDPHNRGTYKEGSYGGSMSFKRLTGDAKFTDKMVFTLTDDGPRCKIEACSESQGHSNGDYSTNYCNLKMLFCGSSDECYPVIHDFTSSDETTTAIAGGSAKITDCFNGPQA